MMAVDHNIVVVVSMVVGIAEHNQNTCPFVHVVPWNTWVEKMNNYECMDHYNLDVDDLDDSLWNKWIDDYLASGNWEYIR